MVQAVLEKLVVEQLMHVMQTCQKVWVSERKPKTGEAAGELANDYMRARESDGAIWGPMGDRTNSSGEYKIRCHTCGKEGHVARKNKRSEAKQNAVKKEADKRDSTSEKKVKCYNCGIYIRSLFYHVPRKVAVLSEELVQHATRKGV